MELFGAQNIVGFHKGSGLIKAENRLSISIDNKNKFIYNGH